MVWVDERTIGLNGLVKMSGILCRLSWNAMGYGTFLNDVFLKQSRSTANATDWWFVERRSLGNGGVVDPTKSLRFDFSKWLFLLAHDIHLFFINFLYKIVIFLSPESQSTIELPPEAFFSITTSHPTPSWIPLLPIAIAISVGCSESRIQRPVDLHGWHDVRSRRGATFNVPGVTPIVSNPFVVVKSLATAEKQEGKKHRSGNDTDYETCLFAL